MSSDRRGVVDQACALRRPAGGFGHIRFERGLIDKLSTWQWLTHERLAANDPVMACLSNLRPLLLHGLEVLFCITGQGFGEHVRPRPDGLSLDVHPRFPAPDHQASDQVWLPSAPLDSLAGGLGVQSHGLEGVEISQRTTLRLMLPPHLRTYEIMSWEFKIARRWWLGVILLNISLKSIIN